MSDLPLRPEDIPDVWALLKGSLRNDAAERKQAEALLQQWSLRGGFCSCMVAVLREAAVDNIGAKWLAAVQLKNSASRRWISGSARSGYQGSTIGEAEKDHIRAELLRPPLLADKDNKVALLLAVTVAKVARHDFPAAWPNLFETLLDPLSKTDLEELTARRIWLTLHHVLKELATKRLPADKRRFRDLAARLAPLASHFWTQHAQAIAEGLPVAVAAGEGSLPAALESALERWMLLTKVVRRLLLHGFQKDSDTLVPTPWAVEILPKTAQMLQFLLSQRPAAPSASRRAHAMLDASILKVLKLNVTVVQVHPWALEASGCLGPLLSLCCDVVARPSEGFLGWPRISARAMRVITLVLQSPAYLCKEQLVSLLPQNGNLEEMIAHWRVRSTSTRAMMASFWQVERRRERLLEAIISLHLPLTAAEARAWDSDAEDFFHEGAGQALEDEPRGVVDVLLREIVSVTLPPLALLVAETLEHVRPLAPAAALAAGADDATTCAALRQKEATYAAACALEFEMHDYVDFAGWLRGSLLPELQACCKPAHRALKRRCMLVLKAWAANVPSTRRHEVHTALLQTLNENDADVAVRLTAADTLRVYIEDWDFVDEQFAPCLAPLLHCLPGLLAACSSYESHALIFAMVSSVVERMGDYVTPHAAMILSWLPDVWASSVGQALLRMQVLSLLQRLLNALGSGSTRAYDVVMPILEHSLKPDSLEAVNLLEDGLALWLVMLRNAPLDATEPLQFWAHWVAVMRLSVEHVQVCMRIATSAILLGGAHFLQVHGQSLSEALVSTIEDVKSAALIVVVVPMIFTVGMFGESGVALLQKPMIKLLRRLMQGGEEVLPWCKSVTLFARALVHCPTAARHLFHAAASSGVTVPQQLLAATAASLANVLPGDALLIAFFADVADKFDAIAQPGDRKLCAMAFASALALPAAGVVSQLEGFAGAITAAHGASDIVPEEVACAFDTGAGYDLYAGLLSSRGDLEAPAVATVAMSEDAEGETQRKQAVTHSDIVRQAKLGDWVKQRVTEAVRVHGTVMQAAVQALPPVISKQFLDLLK